ncbi:hypothetical protein CHU95_12560 [Niveispirillum lacus]|uniref:Uncharacterized protein n=1 Tax=Niveispirillum lacus TaxID=1981099 RepID=A0A255YYK1_9PROT|nr:hypothetical protein [Niveispirillum lacus]OYQ34268.1 hypothetical protein CHU95_12560 [Niveispirillum lacus]
MALDQRLVATLAHALGLWRRQRHGRRIPATPALLFGDAPLERLSRHLLKNAARVFEMKPKPTVHLPTAGTA